MSQSENKRINKMKTDKYKLVLTYLFRFDSLIAWVTHSRIRSSRNHNIVTGKWLNVC